MQPDPSPTYLAECLSHNPDTGEIVWRDRPLSHFKSTRAFKCHATARAGRPAGCVDSSTGYAVIGLSGKLLYAHRVAWALMYGEWPPEQIDHIDGNKLNNAATNLRSVSAAENNRNIQAKRSNRSGVTGVGFARREGKWRARIMLDYRDIHCGYFDSKKEAEEARELAAEAYGFHPNHGRFK